MQFVCFFFNICRKFEVLIFQGSVATCPSWGGYCHLGFVAHFVRFPELQTFWKSANIWQNYRQLKGGDFFETQCSSGRQPNFAALNRGRHLYSAGRPSRWALAHISSFIFFGIFVYYTCNDAFVFVLLDVWKCSSYRQDEDSWCRQRLCYVDDWCFWIWREGAI